MKKFRFDLSELLFFISIFLFQLANFAQNTIFIKPINSYIFYLALAINFLNIIIKAYNLKVSFKNIIVIILLILISIISYIITKDHMIIELISILISAINIKFKKILKYDFKIKVFLLIFIISCYFLGFVSIKYFYRNFIQIRYTFGFNHPNTLGFFIMTLYFEYIYLHNNINMFKFFSFSIIAFFICHVADSRASEIGILLFFFINLFKNKKMNCELSKSRFRKFIIINLFIILLVFSLFITYGFVTRQQYAIELNKILSSRLFMQAYYFENNYGITLFGKHLDYVYTIDNLFIKLLVNYGIISIIFYYYIYKNILLYSYKKNDRLMIVIVFILLVYGLMEWYPIRPVLNVFLFYFSSSIISDEVNRNEK